VINSSFSALDWGIFALYFLLLVVSSYLLSRGKIDSSRDYFVATMPTFAVAVSLLATSQSAATFLGAPEYSYKGDFTFIGFYVSALVAIVFVAYVLVPRFYALKAITVYELLEKRYGSSVKKQAGVMFLIGRIIASGARLYIGALAISMILFSDITFAHVMLSAIFSLLGALAYTYFGGIRSIVFSDVLQAFIYTAAGVGVALHLYLSLDGVDIYSVLESQNKLNFIDTSLSGEFSLLALFSGWLLLNIAAFGLDQDMMQRVLSCKNTKEATKSLYISMFLTIAVVMLFLAIGSLLYLHYHEHTVVQKFETQSITIFMYYILNEMPDGLKAFVTIGAVATTLSSTNSVLGAMASVVVEDIYKPYRLKKSATSEEHFVKISRYSTLVFALLLFIMVCISYYYQQYSNLSLLSFALGVMAFSYTGLLGIYASAIFTKRGNSTTTLLALVGGFVTVLALQPYTFGINLAFSYQIVIGSVVAFAIVQLGKSDG